MGLNQGTHTEVNGTVCGVIDELFNILTNTKTKVFITERNATIFETSTEDYLNKTFIFHDIISIQ